MTLITTAASWLQQRLLSRARICLTVRDATITVAAVRRGRCLWSRTVSRDPCCELATDILATLEFLPATLAKRRRRLVISVSGVLAQVKILTGIPAASITTLRKMIAAGGERFFTLGHGARMSGSVRRSPQGVWAAAYSQDLIDAVQSACVAAHIVEVMIVPLAAMLGTPGCARAIRFADGCVEMAARYDTSGNLIGLERRLLTSEEEGASRKESATTMPKCDSADVNIHSAIAAVSRGRKDPLSLRLTMPRQSRLALNARRLALLVCSISCAAAVVAPGALAHHRARNAAALIRIAHTDGLQAIRARHELLEANRGIAELAAFDDGNLPVTVIMARIARALPPSSALIALQIDSVGGAAVLAGPRASDLLEAMEHVPGVAASTIIGPIAPEQVPQSAGQSQALGGVSVQSIERVTIHFQFAKHSTKTNATGQGR